MKTLSIENEIKEISDAADTRRGRLNIVITGHVDHGKSTVIGRLLADTGSLPRGRLEQVKTMCEKNAKPFEYAFLLDALKDERSQGITIDSARCFFKTKKRDYIVIDAPGHVEFLKNMVTGAARAEAALLVICASEGIQENSRRHGYLVSMLGIRQVVILLNKMDLVNYDQLVYDRLVSEYGKFLSELNVTPVSFIPISAREGVNITAASKEMPWYRGLTLLEQLDGFQQQKGKEYLPLRFPLQDVYKFTRKNDDRRILAGTIETGIVRVGDEVIFLPSHKRSRIRSIEAFNVPRKTEAGAGEAIGVTIETQIYIKAGEIMVKPGETMPRINSRIKSNIFWMGKSPLIKGKTYKMKLATSRVNVSVAEILHVLDAVDLRMNYHKQQLDRHDVGEVILESVKPVAFDYASVIEGTARFVLVDNYEIAGGGTIIEEIDNGETLLEKHIHEREIAWDKGFVTAVDRFNRYKHTSKFIVLTGEAYDEVTSFAKELERKLFLDGYHTYYIGLNNVISGIGSDTRNIGRDAGDSIMRLGELARIITDSGQILITALTGVDDYDLEILKLLNEPAEIIVINVGPAAFSRFNVDLEIPDDNNLDVAIGDIYELLKKKEVIVEYYI
ncbi:MAG: adenylyl-sulfate kinase [Spirochaetes bacterium RBG_16_49_21]|nr:MAG: adenylyl-sulfate kinase [Spirochaetes bacterium RBG_16_49_21]